MDYFLCILMVMCHEGSVISKHELICQNISSLSCRFQLTGIKQVCPKFILYPYSLGGIGEGIKQERKIENCVENRTQPCFSLFPTLNSSETSPLKLTDAFIPLCNADISLSGHFHVQC